MTGLVQEFTHRNSRLLPSECGNPNVLRPRIIGGYEPLMGSVPWVARLGFRRLADPPCTLSVAFLCGGALISSRYVITAAGCVAKRERAISAVLVLVRLGEHDDETNPDCRETVCNLPHEDYFVEDINVHRKFDPVHLYNDLALVRVNRTIIFTDFIRPICMPTAYLSTDNGELNKVAFSGWGANHPKKQNTVLTWFTLLTLNQSFCESAYKTKSYEYKMSPGQLCAYPKCGGALCKGDTGGPLQMVDNDTNLHHLVGVASYTRSCTCLTYPALFTQVYHYLTWIFDQMKP
ncbi:hypothetical protein QAD02_017533 [Eretmocerus hayati]|uniref:Uncharacterized protein n=1 Tax=Eretmocerus hayati TaxID=131215 RepID=A0ACC2PE44_9HYME|nr:hypothetical protein QAD02_017533 [Eretmocerus hayati]